MRAYLLARSIHAAKVLSPTARRLTSNKCCRYGSETTQTRGASLLLRLSRRTRRVRDVVSLESDYIRAEAPKPLPPSPVRVSRRSQLMAALRQHKHPIVIEDQDLAQPFVRLLQARDIKLRPVGAIVAEMMSYAIRRCYGSDVENDWYIGG